MMRPGALFFVAASLLNVAPAQAASDRPALDEPDAEQAARPVDVILARPLFRPSRRPAPAGAGVAVPTRPALPRLAGMFSGPFGTRAMFAFGDKTIVAAKGERIGAWTVTAIAGRSATLATVDDEQELFIAFAPSALAGSESTKAPFWSNPCGRLHGRNAAASTVVPPELCRAAI